MPYPEFDRSRLLIKPLDEREHDVPLDYQLTLDAPLPDNRQQIVEDLGAELVAARERGASRLLMMGAHVIRSGVALHLVDMMERGLITHIALNGAGPIHDYETALIGATCESVPRYISSGEFGLWRETGVMNEIIAAGFAEGLGYGECLGKEILEGDYPNKDFSVLAQAYRLGVPVTVHIGMGYDILHEHPNCDGAALGGASYRDFLVFCKAVENLEGGVMYCLGSAVMGPEVYLKALAMSRNVAHQEGRKIANFTTAAFDLIKIEGDPKERAPKSNPQIITAPGKRFWCGQSPTAGQAIMCGVPIASRCRNYGMERFKRVVKAAAKFWKSYSNTFSVLVFPIKL